MSENNKISPDFTESDKIFGIGKGTLDTAQTFKDHFSEQEGMATEPEAIPHSAILVQLIECFEALDFYALAFPQIEGLRKQLAELDKKLTKSDGSLNDDEALYRERKQWKDINDQIDNLTLNTKHFLILSIENIRKIAEEKEWGLCKNNGFIYLYNGTHWATVNKEAFQKFLGEASEKMGVAKYSARYYKFRDELFKQFNATEFLPSPVPPKDIVLINLRNGTFEVTPIGTKLRPFDRADFLTYQLPFNYNPTAKAPLFDTYLNKVLPDKDSQKILSEYLGYVFVKTSSLKLEKILFLFGSGANGKSVCFDIVRALYGDQNTSEYSLSDLTDTKGYCRAMIANKLVNYASEISGKHEAAILKQLASGEPLSARLPYGEPFNITDYAKLIFNANEMSKDVEQTHAYYRRHLIIPFNVTITEAEQDKELAKKIIAKELSGVFNWVLDGLHRLLKQKTFSECEAARAAVEQYALHSDSVKMFIEDNAYKPSPNSNKLIKTFYLEYRAYCIEEGMSPVKKTNFIKRLQACSIIIEKNHDGNVAFVDKSKQ